MIDMVITYLCTDCREYFEGYLMADTDEHLCLNCAGQREMQAMKGNTRLPGDLLGRWTRLVARLEAIEQGKQADGDWLDIDWSDVAVLNAHLTEDAELQAAQAAGEWIDVEYNDVINVDNSNQIRVVIDQGKRDKRIHLHVRKRVDGEWSHVGVTTLSDDYRLQKRIGSQENNNGTK